jgi:hypothetical protein
MGNKMIERPRGIEVYCSKLKGAEGYTDVWAIVKDSVKTSLGKHRVGMMLFLDDLPLRLGAYHPVGTNNIVLNRRLVEIVEANTDSKLKVNAFVYSLLLHEYLHAIGYLSEDEVRHLVQRVCLECFGKNHVATELARNSPWALFAGMKLDEVISPKAPMKVVKDFDGSNVDYIR